MDKSALGKLIVFGVGDGYDLNGVACVMLGDRCGADYCLFSGVAVFGNVHCGGHLGLAPSLCTGFGGLCCGGLGGSGLCGSGGLLSLLCGHFCGSGGFGGSLGGNGSYLGNVGFLGLSGGYAYLIERGELACILTGFLAACSQHGKRHYECHYRTNLSALC